MRTEEKSASILNGYIGLLNNLSPSNKLDLIAKLTESLKIDLKTKKSSFKKAFGAFVSEKPAEEIIQEIRSSRKFNRQIESF